MAQENYDIFISYSRKDSAIADQICAALDSAGITYFIDRQGIGGGFEFPAVLAENIVNSKIFLLLASKNSYESKFTMNEIVFAFNKKPKNAILPYIIDNSSLPISLEFVFAGINWRNMTDHPIDPTLVDDLLKLLGRERVNKATEKVKVATDTATLLTEREKLLLSLSDREFERIEKNGKYGFKLKSTEEVVIPIMYDDVDYVFGAGLAGVKLNDKWGFIDKTGKVRIPIKYESKNCFDEGLASVAINGKWGFIDKEGNEVIPFVYDGAEYFTEGWAQVKLNNKWGFINKAGNITIHIKYDYLDNFSEGLAAAELNGKYGYIDKTGTEVIPFKYDNAFSFSEGLASVIINNKYGFIDVAGNEVVPCKYDGALGFHNGFAVVSLENEWFSIDREGNRRRNKK